MNGDSLQNNENPEYCEGPLPQGLYEARQGKDVSVHFRSLIRRGGVPSEAAAFIIIIPETIFKYYLNMLIFMGNLLFPILRSLLYGCLEGAPFRIFINLLRGIAL